MSFYSINPAKLKLRNEIFECFGCYYPVDEKPMVMVDDVLYLDTGKESDSVRDDGLLDGEITSKVDQSQIPTENNQSNFGTGYGYQYGANGTIVICINEKWCVFEAEQIE